MEKWITPNSREGFDRPAYNALNMTTRVATAVVASLLLAGCASGGPVQLAPGPQAADLLQGTWVGDSSGNAGTPFWLFVQEVAGATVRGEEWGLQDANRWERFTGTIEPGLLRIELPQLRQVLLLHAFDPGDGTLELRGRTAASPPGESSIRLKRAR